LLTLCGEFDVLLISATCASSSSVIDYPVSMPQSCRDRVSKSRISLIALPYDSGRLDTRMGRGPGAILERGLAEHLRSKQFDVAVTSIRLPERFWTEGSALVELQLQAALAVREAVSRGAQPVLLSGNCGPAALAATAALGPKTTGVIWFDAHGDFNTPETSASGFLDGMALAILSGQCWSKLAGRFESFAPVPMEHIIQIGVRDIDPEEAMRLEQSGITRVGSNELVRLPEAIRELAHRVGQVYVHVDVDVLDLSEGWANTYACRGGLMLEDLYGALEMIGPSVKIGAGSITSYDPEADRDNRIGRAIPHLVELLAR
jgi:arginase